MGKKKDIVGAAAYASLNVHLGKEASRRDDLESLGYVLMYLNLGKLPWQGKYSGSGISPDTMKRRITRCKEKMSCQELCQGFPQAFVQYFRHCRSLEYGDEPDYCFLRRLLGKAFASECGRVLRFDWNLSEEELEIRRDKERKNRAARSQQDQSRKKTKKKSNRSDSNQKRKQSKESGRIRPTQTRN